MYDAVGYWMDQAGRYPILPDSELYDLLRQIKQLDKADPQRNKLINKVALHNMRLVVHVVGRITSTSPCGWGHPSAADLLQEGFSGLQRAAETYSFKSKSKFSSWAGLYIRQRVSRYRMRTTTMIRLPEKVAYDAMHFLNTGEVRFTDGGCQSQERLVEAVKAMTVGSTDKPVKEGLYPEFGDEHKINSESYDDPRIAKFHELLDQAGVQGTERQLMLAYLKRPNVVSAAGKCGVTQPVARRIIRQTTERLKNLV